MISRIFVICIFCQIFIRNVQNLSKQCASGWSYNAGSCYYIKTTSSEDVTNQVAQSRCRSSAASLAIPNSANEFAFMIGLVNRYANNTFYAIDNSTTYQKWRGGFPSGRTWGVMYDGALIDNYGEVTYYYMCEKASCTTSQYYSNATSSCQNWNSCTTVSDCGSGSNLACINGLCSCDTNYLWTGYSCETCPSGWLSNGSSCYNIVKSNLTYAQSLARCKGYGMGSTLAIPNTNDELTYLKSLAITAGINSYVGIYDTGSKKFTGIDGSSVSLSWCSRQPSNGLNSSTSQPYVTLSSSNGCMNDVTGNDNYYSICEITK